ncbi:MAG TPA: hypothetical protein VL361_14530 [Candidatus Limnocylindrales bacterium]|nr:hypothetical protein [Candidatus Limnocylindrales bacterium]
MLPLTYSLADQDFLRTKSIGIFDFSVNLLKSLADGRGDFDLAVLVNSTLKNWLQLPAAVSSQQHDTAIAGRLRRMWWDQWGVYRAARQTRKEWLFLPKGFASFACRCPVKLALYIHDTILDSYYVNRPGVSKLELLYFSKCLGASLTEASVIFTNNDFTRREIERSAQRRGIKAPLVVSVGRGIEAAPVARHERSDSILVLTSPFPHKRTDLALEYLGRWQRQSGYSGKVEWVGRLPTGLSLPGFVNWRQHSRLPQAEFQEVRQRSCVLVFFSDYEGFGLPPVEAIMGGLCPVYSEIEATREVMAGMGCPFRNDSYESFAGALQTALATTAAQIEAWKEKLLIRFSWSRVRDQLVQTLVSLQSP